MEITPCLTWPQLILSHIYLELIQTLTPLYVCVRQPKEVVFMRQMETNKILDAKIVIDYKMEFVQSTKIVPISMVMLSFLLFLPSACFD